MSSSHTVNPFVLNELYYRNSFDRLDRPICNRRGVWLVLLKLQNVAENPNIQHKLSGDVVGFHAWKCDKSAIS